MNDMLWQDPQFPFPSSCTMFLCLGQLGHYLTWILTLITSVLVEIQTSSSSLNLYMLCTTLVLFPSCTMFQLLIYFHCTLSGIQSAITKSSILLTSSLNILALTKPWFSLKDSPSQEALSVVAVSSHTDMGVEQVCFLFLFNSSRPFFFLTLT